MFMLSLFVVDEYIIVNMGLKCTLLATLYVWGCSKKSAGSLSAANAQLGDRKSLVQDIVARNKALQLEREVNNLLNTIREPRDDFSKDIPRILRKMLSESIMTQLKQRGLEIREIKPRPSQVLLDRCVRVVTERRSNPGYLGDFTMGLWEQNEKPAEGETSAYYRLDTGFIPFDVMGGKAYCVGITFVRAMRSRDPASPFDKSIALFMKQDASSDDAWDAGPDDTHPDNSELGGASDLDRLHLWIKANMRSPIIGVNLLETFHQPDGNVEKSSNLILHVAKKKKSN